MCSSLAVLIKFIPEYFILFDAIILIFFSDCALLMYRNATDFLHVDFVFCNFAESFTSFNRGFLWNL